MENKELTIKQKYRRAKAGQYSLMAAEYVSVVTPYSIMAIVNRNEWFIANPEPWKVGLGGAIALVLVSLATLLVTLKKENKEITNGFIALVLGWYAVTFVFFLLANINMEIYKIMAIGGLGLIGAMGLDYGSRHFEKKAKELKTAITNAKTNLDTEQATKEILKEEEKKKVKIKVVK